LLAVEFPPPRAISLYQYSERGPTVKYLCLVYPLLSTAARPRGALLLRARDLNLAVSRLHLLPLEANEWILLWRLAPLANSSHKETLMKYLCLVYSDEQQLHSLPDSPEDSECQAYAESVAGSGRMLAAEALQPVNSATTVRLRGGQVSITDGPFAETKEQLGGFFMVEAKDLNEALQIAARIPSARTGSIEVRPISEGGCRQPSR